MTQKEALTPLTLGPFQTLIYFLFVFLFSAEDVSQVVLLHPPPLYSSIFMYNKRFHKNTHLFPFSRN